MRRFSGATLSVVVVLSAQSAWAQFSVGASETTIDFVGFTGTGFQTAPSAGQLSSNHWAIAGFTDGDLAFGGSQVSGDFARGTSNGNVMTGGIYAFSNDGSNRFLGVQPASDDMTPGTVTLWIRNDSGATSTDVQLGYRLWFLNDEGYSSSVSFSLSTDNVTYTPIPGLTRSTAAVADAVPAWVFNDVSTTEAVAIAANGNLYLRWTFDDLSGSGARDELGIDNVRMAFVVPGDAGAADAGADPETDAGQAGADASSPLLDAALGFDAAATLDASSAGGAGAGGAEEPEAGLTPPNAGAPNMAGSSSNPDDGGSNVGGTASNGDAGDDLAEGSDSGCGCSVVGAEQKQPLVWALVGLLISLIGRRLMQPNRLRRPPTT